MLCNSSSWYSSFLHTEYTIYNTCCMWGGQKICVTHRLGKYLTPNARWLRSARPVTTTARAHLLCPGAAFTHILAPCSELSRREVPPPAGGAEQPLLAEIHTKELKAGEGSRNQSKSSSSKPGEEHKPANYLCILLPPSFFRHPDALCKSLPSSGSPYQPISPDAPSFHASSIMKKHWNPFEKTVCCIQA